MRFLDDGSRTCLIIRTAASWALCWVLAGLTGCTSPPSPSPPRGAAAGQDPPGSGEDVAPDKTLQIRVAERTLLNPSPDIRQQDRRDAAQLLLSNQVETSLEAIGRGLRSGDEDILEAVLWAMEETPTVPPSLLTTTVSSLKEAPPRMRDAIARVLARYGPDGLRQVALLACDRDQPPQARLGAIAVLSTFWSPSSAEKLVSLLADDSREPKEIVDAACASLERMTTVQYGNDRRLWLNWWKLNKNKTPAEWATEWARTLATRIAELQKEMEQDRRERDKVVARLVESLREQYLLLPKPQQLVRLAALLGDDLPAVREFALGRIDQRLRDSEPIPEDLQQKLVELLNDPVPKLRIRAAQCLDKANYPQIGQLLADRLLRQSDPEVISSFLTIMAGRPDRAALDSCLRWLGDSGAPALSDASASLLWSLIESDGLPEARRREAAAILRTAAKSRTSPLLIRALCAIGDDADVAAQLPLLDSPDAQLRVAVAQGLAKRGFLGPLLQHASDSAVYPSAVKLAAEQAPDLPSLQTLLNLAPPEKEQAGLWRAAVVKLSTRLPAPLLLDADDMIAAAPGADLALRIDCLSRAADVPAGTPRTEQQARTVVRLAELLLESSQAQRAHEVLDRLDGMSLTPAQIQTRFRAAVLAGKYDKAVAIEEAPKEWVELFTELAGRNDGAAKALQVEIQRRFGDELDDRTRRDFRVASDLLDSHSPPTNGRAQESRP